MELVLTKLTQLPKDFCNLQCQPGFYWLTQEITYELVSIELGQLMKDFIILACKA